MVVVKEENRGSVIHEIAIRNYQSLQSVTVKLGKITVITGHTDSGKSALIRALERAFFNDSGHNFLSVFEGQVAERAQVAIKTDEGVVVWERTKTTVRYRVVRGGKETVFAKLGRGYVPEEVMEVLGIRTIKIDAGAGALQQQRIQLSGQFDLPFLVADRGGVAASRVLGRLTGLNVFSYANKGLTSDKTAINSELNSVEQARAAKELELAGYQGLDAHKAAYVGLKTALSFVAIKQNRLSEYVRLASHLNRVNSAISMVDIDRVNACLSDLQQIQLTALRSLWNKLSALSKLRQLRQRYLSTKKDLAEIVVRNVPSKPDFGGNLEKHHYLSRIKQALVLLKSRLAENKANQIKCDTEVTEATESLVALERDFPLCPFKDQFSTVAGTYRCRDLMKVIQGSKQCP